MPILVFGRCPNHHRITTDHTALSYQAPNVTRRFLVSVSKRLRDGHIRWVMAMEVLSWWREWVMRIREGHKETKWLLGFGERLEPGNRLIRYESCRMQGGRDRAFINMVPARVSRGRILTASLSLRIPSTTSRPPGIVARNSITVPRCQSDVVKAVIIIR